MNAPVRRLMTVVALMFLALMASATWTQFFAAGSLNADGRNVRTIYQEYGRDRGPIIVAGEPIATSTPVDDIYGYQREYHQPELYAHLTGYFAAALGSMTGLEQAENNVLNGTADSLVVQRVQNLITGRQPQGGSVELTIDPRAQQAARDALGDQRGAVVALDPSTGAVLALVSTPGFDPGPLASHDGAAAQRSYDELLADEADPLVNRAIGGDLYAPGSAFKTIVAAALLESGDYDTESLVPSPAQLALPLSSHVILNPGGIDCTGGDEAPLSYTFAQSCNTTFGALAMELGADAIAEQAAAFGFDQAPRIPLRASPSHYPTDLDDAETALTGIGQQDVRVTPLQMAMVVQAIANDGEQLLPYLIATERRADLEVVTTTEPSVLRQSVSPHTAEVLTELMVGVVEDGTGGSAQLPGVDVAAKTGSAQTGTGTGPHAWFTAFAPADDPQVALAVFVEEGGRDGEQASGGTTAGPIARAVLESLVVD